MRLRGREQSHAELWLSKLEEIVDLFKDCAQIAQPARIEGKMITATIEPVGGATATVPADKGPTIISADGDDDED